MVRRSHQGQAALRWAYPPPESAAARFFIPPARKRTLPVMAQGPGGAVLLHMHGAVPIPIGHRVEVVVYYATTGSGFFGGGAPAPMHETPLLTDLETGVRYGTLPQFHPPVNMYTHGQLFRASPTPLPTLQEHSRWVGKVVVCNVLHLQLQGGDIQTTLVVEPMLAPSPGYR